MDDFASANVADHLTVLQDAPQPSTTLAYPISPEYVKSWTPVRALCELIANALDEDSSARVSWAGGVLTISDEGPGIPEEGLVLGYSSKSDVQIGQFGEGKKLACLVLARAPDVGQVRYETVGYGFTPAVERRQLLDGLAPSRSQDGTEVLVYHLNRNLRSRGTVVTVACSQNLAEEAIGRFRTLSEPNYQMPNDNGECVLTGQPGRIWIGGVLVTTMPGLRASYDLPLAAKGLQSRDRTVIEAGALRDSVRAILASSENPDLIARFARHALSGGKLREPEQFFADVHNPRVRAAWRAWGRVNLPPRCFYTAASNEEATLDLVDKGFTELTAEGLPRDQLWALMERLGVELARARRVRHYERTRGQTTWVPFGKLSDSERNVLTQARRLIRQAIGAFALDRVLVYSASKESPCSLGFYNPRTTDVAIHRNALGGRSQALQVLLHEAAHRVAHRGGGQWLPTIDYHDRNRGFERVLGDFAALLLGRLADGETMAELHDIPSAEPPATRSAPVDDPAVPAIRRALAHLLIDQTPYALKASGFADENDMVGSTAVHPDYWRTLTNPKVAGHRQQRGGRAWDYDKVALLAEAVGVHPPVVWLAYHLCEGPIYGRPQRRWADGGPWTGQMRKATLRACADLQSLGGAYAEQIPALHALLDGRTITAVGDDSWHAPARELLALEHQRLRLKEHRRFA
ncbi:hypothetical protein JIG36_48760 [Actinoplanes sp. LDG1-06]|uniref:Uncharacterized protein n=1 Tax=Paractinoplanes ovalisporus TaxID=2810368 RepID=A0ABS2AU69_9ACTN|nr:hypothetical protein [Actinoplanes ovalisporus]MBM2623414.1 hypothetical protein [Actinoplanes ovalisporus]